MKQRGAIVAPTDSTTALAIARALDSRRIPVVAFDTYPRSLGFFSRHIKSAAYAPIEREEEVLKALQTLGERRRGWVLYPTSDFYITVVARHHEAVSGKLVPTVPPWEVTKHFIDKLETFRLAKRLGIPVPETYAPETMEEVDRLCDRLDFEGQTWLVKVRRRLFSDGMLGPFARAKGINIRSPEELRLVCLGALSTGCSPPLVQERIPGPPHHYVAFNSVLDHQGKPVAWLTKRVLRTSPYEFGVTSVLATTYDSNVIRLSLRFGAATGANCCFFSTAFIEDPRDNSLKLIECHCRAVMNSEVWRRSGMDLIDILHSMATGEEYELPRLRRIGVRFTNLVEDLTVLLTDREHYSPTLALTWRVAKDYANTRAWALLSARDPVPFMIYALRRFGKRKLRGKLSVGR